MKVKKGCPQGRRCGLNACGTRLAAEGGEDAFTWLMISAAAFGLIFLPAWAFTWFASAFRLFTVAFVLPLSSAAMAAVALVARPS